MPTLGVDREELHACWDRIIDSGHFTEGEFVKAFEGEVSAWSGMYAVAVSSAGAGLFTVMRCLDIPRGPVMVPNNTFFATGAMVREARFGVVPADCSRIDFSLTEYTLQKDWMQGTVAVVLTHVGGALAMEYEGIAEMCRDMGIPLIEDAAHAMGASRGGLVAGSLGEAAVYSMYPTKAVPAGEGGVIVTKNAKLAEQCRRFRNYGKQIRCGVVHYDGEGFNFRMDEWTAAVAYLQMKRLPAIMRNRINQAHRLKNVIPPWRMWPDGESNWYKYPVLATNAETVVRKTGKIYSESDQLNSSLGVHISRSFPNSEAIAQMHVCLPLDEGLYDNMAPHEIMAFLEGK